MNKLIKNMFSKMTEFNMKDRFVGFEVHKNPFGTKVKEVK